ncbi:hypothetical protein [Sphingopyxis sp.]|uniref:hypothetical protein n=1 Tax=Sphingopyxis sp. TaxID=1908224 RepID=UPI003D09E2A2
MARRMVMILVTLALAAFAVPSAAAEPPLAPSFGDLAVAPDAILGIWKMVGEKCEEGETPSTKQVDALIRFERDFGYELTVEGWTSRGRYRVEQMRDAPLRIQLADVLYEFDLVDGRLENWSEGEAVFLCGRIFERVTG